MDRQEPTCFFDFGEAAAVNKLSYRVGKGPARNSYPSSQSLFVLVLSKNLAFENQAWI